MAFAVRQTPAPVTPGTAGSSFVAQLLYLGAQLIQPLRESCHIGQRGVALLLRRNPGIPFGGVALPLRRNSGIPRRVALFHSGVAFLLGGDAKKALCQVEYEGGPPLAETVLAAIVAKSPPAGTANSLPILQLLHSSAQLPDFLAQRIPFLLRRNPGIPLRVPLFLGFDASSRFLPVEHDVRPSYNCAGQCHGGQYTNRQLSRRQSVLANTDSIDYRPDDPIQADVKQQAQCPCQEPFVHLTGRRLALFYQNHAGDAATPYRSPTPRCRSIRPLT